MLAVSLYSMIHELFWQTIKYFLAKFPNSRENADRLQVILVVDSNWCLHNICIYMCWDRVSMVAFCVLNQRGTVYTREGIWPIVPINSR